MQPDLSVIIPCYNSGQLLLQAIESVRQHPDYKRFQIIVINDGSTDSVTIDILRKIIDQEIEVIHQINRGPAAARNTGVRKAQSDFILFLDSDNRVKQNYIDNGIKVLKSNSKVGVVYGDPEFIGGSVERFFYPRKFNRLELIRSNYIDICTIIRKQVWEDVSGFDENRNLTQEDWEFWLRVLQTDWEFFYLQEPSYEYRIREGSHVVTSKANYNNLLKYVFTKHPDLFIESFRELNHELYILKIERANLVKTTIKNVIKKLKIQK